MRPAPFEWPNGAKIAASFFVTFESFVAHSNFHSGSGDKPDFISLAYGEFGGRAGIWRLMDLLNKYNIKGCITTNGLAAKKFPDAVKELHAAGHEIVAHGWANDIRLDTLSPEKERQNIKESVDIIASLTGVRPVGWISPGNRITDHTFEYIVEEGIYWIGDVPRDEVPYHIDVNGKPLVIMPRLDYASDLSHLYTPKNPPSVYFECYKESFDLLYAEGAAGYPKVMDARVHAHIGGRPNTAGVFEKCIRYAKEFPDVWFCTKAQIARWYMDRYAKA